MPVLPKNLQDMALAIASSHNRSKKYNIDPNLTKAPESTRLTSKELEERIENQKTFYTVAKEQIDKLYTLLQGTGFCMALADKEVSSREQDGICVPVAPDARLRCGKERNEASVRRFHGRNALSVRGHDHPFPVWIRKLSARIHQGARDQIQY